jgi:hypothetical protein
VSSEEFEEDDDEDFEEDDDEEEEDEDDDEADKHWEDLDEEAMEGGSFECSLYCGVLMWLA